MSAVIVITAPVVEPVSLTEMKLHLRETESDQDAVISALIRAAREYAENLTRRAFVTQTLELRLDDGFPAEIKVPRPPLQSVSFIKYLDLAGVLQTLAASVYQINSSEPARIKPAYNQYWPTIRGGDFSSVQVRFVAGYLPLGSPDDYAGNVPEGIKQWMKVRVAQLYENREATIVGTIVQPIHRDFVDGLLDPHVVDLLGY